MKNKILFKLLLIYLAFTVSYSNAQIYTLSPPGGSVFTTCKGFVQNDLNFGYYYQGDNYWTTFQSGTPGMPIKINFTYLDLNTGDFVRVYEGVGISGPLLASYTNTLTTLGSAVTSTTGIITIRFTTDLDGNVGEGYTAIVGCPPVGCGGNVPAADVCLNAARICDTDPYCGNTGGWYTADNEQIALNGAEGNWPTPFTSNGPFCGSIENNSWIVFKANAALPTFSVNVGNCASTASGIQMLLLNSTNCNTFSAVSNCISQNSTANSFTIGATVPLTVGNDYYIMVDGFGGNYCDYTVTPLTGVQIATLNASAPAICQNQTLPLNTSNAVAGSTYSWTASTSGAIGSSSTSSNIIATPTVVGNTIYTVTITQPNGCAAQSYTRQVTLNPLPIANAGTSPASITCANPTQPLSGSGGGSYVWSGTGIVSGANTPNPVVNGPGPYSLVVTSGAGCTSTNVASVSVPVNTAVPGPASISSPTVLNCVNPNITLSGLPSSGVAYSWSGPGIVSGGSTANPIINAGGTYVMNITSSVNGCTNTANINIAAINNTVGALASTSNSITCLNNTISLSASPPSMNYTWTAPGGAAILTGVNSAAATASNAGTYSLNVFNPNNGCSQLTTVAANVNLALPTGTTSSNGVVTCTNSAITLSVAPSGFLYNWLAGSGGTITSGSTTQNPSASGSAIYSVVITNPVNGCTITRTVTPTTNTAIITPTTLPTPAALNCTLTSTNLTANPSSGVTYLWNGPLGFVSTLQNPSVTSPGFYSLVVTNNTNGCQNSISSAVVLVNQVLTTPTLSAASQTVNIICGVASVPISGSANPINSTPLWLGGVTSGANTFTANASAGVYTLQASHPVTGCTSNLTFTVVPDNNVPQSVISSSSGTITCTNTLLTVVGSSTSSPVIFSWTGPGIVGPSNTATVSVNQAGNYLLTVINTNNNCTSTKSFSVVLNNSPVAAIGTLTNNTITCSNPTSIVGGSVSTPGTYNYSWSGPSSFTSSLQSFSIGIGGAYVVTITNQANGCTGTATVNIATNTTIPTGLTVNTNSVNLSSCTSNQATLSASATGATTYSWIAPNPNGSIVSGGNTSTAVINGAGIYSVVAVGSNGCTTPLNAAATVTVSPNINSPTYSITNNVAVLTCVNTTTQVAITSTAQSLVWQQTVGVSGTYTATFTQAGNYIAVLTNTLTNCTASINVSVQSNTAAPSASMASIPSINCTNTLVTLTPIYTPTSNLIYTWSGAGIVGANNNASVQTNTNSPLSVTFTNTSNGCVGTLSVSPTLNVNPPTFTLGTNTSNTVITCATPTITFSGNSIPSTGITYSWSTGQTTPQIAITQAGTYSVTATNTVNGCSSSQTFSVGGGNILPTFTASPTATMACNGTTASLLATSSNTNLSYLWSGGAILSPAANSSVIVGSTGVYTLTVTDNITTCSTTQTVSVSNNNVSAQFTANITSGPSPLNVNFNNTSIGATSYSWNLGSNQGSSNIQNPSNIYTETGTYTVQLFAFNGSCVSTATIEIEVKAALGEIPEVFTPNGDLLNPTFEIKGLESYPKNSLEIYNRWGNPVYSSKPYKNDWDGRPNKSSIGSDKLPTGTYFYILDLGDEKIKPIKGYVQLVY